MGRGEERLGWRGFCSKICYRVKIKVVECLWGLTRWYGGQPVSYIHNIELMAEYYLSKP